MKIIGNFYDIGKAIASDVKKFDIKLSKDIKRGVQRAGDGLKLALRAQTEAAGLGPRLAKTWQNKTYPKTGNSKDAATIVYSKAPHIISGYDKGALLRNKYGFWLAIPTENIPIGLKGKKLSPGDVEKRLGIILQFVYNKSGASMLIAPGLRKSYARKTGKFRGYKKASAAWIKRGDEIADIVMFYLIPQHRLKKRLNVRQEAEKWLAEMSRLIDEEIARGN